MFTIEQIKAAHSKVKSGADFPNYIKEIKTFGVSFYETYVSDVHTDYYGENDFKVSSPARFEPLLVADSVKTDEFKRELKDHQQGKSDFPTFIKMCAAFGIEKWVVRMDAMTCIYFDLSGNEVLVEAIPQ